MSKWLRRSLARWLCPEVFREAEQYRFEYVRIADAYWWLGEFPEATATLRWILDNHRDWTQPPQKRDHHWQQDIGQFREQLRRGEHLRVYGSVKHDAQGGSHD